ncbi:MAG: hypothetical protein KGZ81_07165 [Flavobacteriales bacterium]|nr:hypothetical protein [Flavobacteriales bacterium]
MTKDKLLLHHAVTPTWEEKSKAWLAQWFSDLGFSRGYGSNPNNWNGLINPYTGQRSYAMAHFAGQRVDSRTPDASDAERTAGFRLVKLVDNPWNVITYHAGNWPVNQTSIGIENLMDARNDTLRDGDRKVIAAFWRPQDQKLNGATAVYGHYEVSLTATQCPARIMEARDAIVGYINNPPVVVAPKPAPVPTPAPKPLENPYTRFENGPINLIVNKDPTYAFDLSKKTWEELNVAKVKTLQKGEPFVAVGKYKHPLGGVYFMTDFSFGNADVDGTPAHPYGVNTVDLSPAPVPVPESVKPAEPITPVIQEPQPVTETPVSDTPEPPVEQDDGSVSIPVKVTPPDPNKWKESYTAAPNEFVARLDSVIKDISGEKQDIALRQGQTVHVAGQFEKDGVKYYRTQRSVENGWWYGIPFKTQSIDTLLDTDDVFDLDIDDIVANLTLKEKLIKFVALVTGWFSTLGKKTKE